MKVKEAWDSALSVLESSNHGVYPYILSYYTSSNQAEVTASSLTMRMLGSLITLYRQCDIETPSIYTLLTLTCFSFPIYLMSF